MPTRTSTTRIIPGRSESSPSRNPNRASPHNIRGRGYRWLSSTSQSFGPQWFSTTYSRVTGLDPGKYTHEADRRVAAALSTMAPAGADITEFTIRNFRHSSGMKSYTKESAAPTAPAPGPIAPPDLALTSSIDRLNLNLESLLSRLYVMPPPPSLAP